MTVSIIQRLLAGAALALCAAQAMAFTCTGAVKGVALEATSGEVLAESIGTMN